MCAVLYITYISGRASIQIPAHGKSSCGTVLKHDDTCDISCNNGYELFNGSWRIKIILNNNNGTVYPAQGDIRCEESECLLFICLHF